MVLLINILFLLIAFRLLFQKSILNSLMKKRWNNLVNIQHFIFIIAYITGIIFIELNTSETMLFSILKIIFIVVLNSILYYICYSKLVPAFYETNKYSEYILYALILFIFSSLLRILIDPLISEEIIKNPADGISLINIYASQSIVILMSSFLGISKHKFLIESDYKNLEFEKKETDLTLIKSRINPHFLLNTLNNIYAGSYNENSASADAIMQLSQLLQYVIYETSKKRIYLSKEVDMMIALAGLYQLKFKEELPIKFTIQSEDELENFEIPPSIYFTLFENALKHSSIGSDKQAFIEVNFEIIENEMVFSVSNSISQINKATNEYGYKGMGMKDLQKVLAIEFPKKHVLSQKETNNMYFSVLKIKI